MSHDDADGSPTEQISPATDSPEVTALKATIAKLQADNHQLRRECAELRGDVGQLSAFRALADHLPYGVGLWRADGPDPGDMQLLYTNDRAALEWGEEFAQMVGRTLREAVPEALEAPAPFNLPVMWHRVAISATPEVVDPLPYGDPDQPRGWLRAHAVPAGDNLVAMVFDNVTRHIRAERQLHELNRALEQRVRERTARLDDLNQELTAFSYSVSHDLRAPLRTVLGFADALAEDCGDNLGEEGRDHLRRITGAARSMRDRIEGLLLLSRLSRTRMMSETVHLSERVEKICQRCIRSTGAERTITLDVQRGLEVHADPRLIDLLVENLIGNAVKFTATTDPSTIRFGIAKARGTMAFFVADDGVGFDPVHAEKMFKPFQRLHRDTEFPGTGIGLATVQRIVHMHGGRVWAESAPNEGTTLWFTL